MKAIFKKAKLRGGVTAPPSKSITHRMLICGGLCEGKSVIHGVAPSEDILATLDCLKAIGADVTFEGDTVQLIGVKNKGSRDRFLLNCRESGSTLRFFIPLCSVLGKPSVFTGSEKLLSRPLSVYENIFKAQKKEFSNDGKTVSVGANLGGGKFKVKGNISSQFISGLLFSLPLLEEDSEINIIPPIESLSYIDLTVAALSEFGVDVRWTDERTLFIKGGQTYRSKEVFVEGDYSNAAFFEALNYFGNDLKIEGLNENSLQGDKAYKEFFPMLEKGTPTIHLGGCPDLGPVLFAFAAAKNGAVFTGTKRLKLKESNRCEAMAEELKKMGISVKIEENSVLVYPVSFKAPTESLSGHNDHRIVMALSVLLNEVGGTIEGVEAVKKSMPDFFDKLKSVGADVTLSE